MKTPNNIKKPLLILVLIFAGAFRATPSCDPEALFKKFAATLDDYVFIRSFPIETKSSDDRPVYSYVLSRGVNYRIVVCNGEEEKRMIVNLLDRNKKLIASNYIKSGKKFYPTLNYVCSATGVYYVEAFFEGDKKACGLNILGFKK